jgi:hypothetical protein
LLLHTNGTQNARQRAANAGEINEQREIFSKAYSWDIAMLNSNFVVERFCGSAHALPHEFVFLAKGVARMGK